MGKRVKNYEKNLCTLLPAADATNIYVYKSIRDLISSDCHLAYKEFYAGRV